MNAAIPSTTNARTKSQTAPIPAIIPIDIPVMSIIMGFTLSVFWLFRRGSDGSARDTSQACGLLPPRLRGCGTAYCDQPITRLQCSTMRVTWSVVWERGSVVC